jgi:hypothetical protein
MVVTMKHTVKKYYTNTNTSVSLQRALVASYC